MSEPSSDDIIRIGISSCLLGHAVRYDGGHKKDLYLTGVLGKHVEFVPICPEFEVGMGVPRETVRLEGDADSLRMVGTGSGRDWTSQMIGYSRERIGKRDLAHLDGFVFKKNSPSCGLSGVRVYGSKDSFKRLGQGLFAKELTTRYPMIPVEDEGRLSDEVLRENFIVRIFAHNRLRNFLAGRFSYIRLVQFHTAHKYLLLAHSPKEYRELGKLVADAKKYPVEVVRTAYSESFMSALRKRATVAKQVNVLQHIAGFFKRELSDRQRKEIQKTITEYRDGNISLHVILKLMGRYAERFNIEWLKDQWYLDPDPRELLLRNLLI